MDSIPDPKYNYVEFCVKPDVDSNDCLQYGTFNYGSFVTDKSFYECRPKLKLSAYQPVSVYVYMLIWVFSWVLTFIFGLVIGRLM